MRFRTQGRGPPRIARVAATEAALSQRAVRLRTRTRYSSRRMRGSPCCRSRGRGRAGCQGTTVVRRVAVAAMYILHASSNDIQFLRKKAQRFLLRARPSAKARLEPLDRLAARRPLGQAPSACYNRMMLFCEAEGMRMRAAGQIRGSNHD